MTRAAEIAKIIGKGSVDIHGEAGTTSSGSTGKTTNLQQGLAKVWIYSPATSASISDSFNIGSITDGGTGEQDMTFTSAMATANYSSPIGADTDRVHNTGAGLRVTQVLTKTTLLIDARADRATTSAQYAGGEEDAIFYNMTTFGDLA
tara:strand:- start:21 stop:464 length:444 start_codon:yes stop_codon:yes gene_type:complete